MDAAIRLLNMLTKSFGPDVFEGQQQWKEKVASNQMKEEDFPRLIEFFKRSRFGIV